MRRDEVPPKSLGPTTHTGRRRPRLDPDGPLKDP